MSEQVSAQALDQVKGYVDTLLKKWSGKSLNDAVQFLWNSIDDLIRYVDKIIPVGSDKKALVLSMAGTVFDTIVAPRLPFFARVVASPIKNFVVNVVLSYAVDFIVSKYRSGVWAK